jgi:hypothetical protein
MGLRDGQTDSVTFVQRFGGILNLNPHLHSILPDGLFVPDNLNTLTFTPLPSPSDHDIRDLATRLSERMGSIAKTRLHQASEQTDPARDEQKSIFSCTGESLHLPVHSFHDAHDNDDAKPLCANRNRTSSWLFRIFEYLPCSTLINRGIDSFLTHNRFLPQTAALRMENRSNFFS